MNAELARWLNTCQWQDTNKLARPWTLRFETTLNFSSKVCNSSSRDICTYFRLFELLRNFRLSIAASRTRRIYHRFKTLTFFIRWIKNLNFKERRVSYSNRVCRLSLRFIICVPGFCTLLKFVHLLFEIICFGTFYFFDWNWLVISLWNICTIIAILKRCKITMFIRIFLPDIQITFRKLSYLLLIARNTVTFKVV